MKTVSLEVAQLAKELEFNEPCLHAIDNTYKDIHSAYDLTGELYFNQDDVNNANVNTVDEGVLHYLLPTQSQLQKWLRERNVKVEVYTDYSLDDIISQSAYYVAIIDGLARHPYPIDVSFEESGVDRNSYEDCLEEALRQTLKMMTLWN